MSFDAKCGIVVTDEKLKPLAAILSESLKLVSGVQLPIQLAHQCPRPVTLGLDGNLAQEEYRLEVESESISIVGGDYRAVAWGIATLLQLIDFHGETASIPCLKLTDSPDYEFRSVMIDLARRPHPIQTVRETIELLWLYKIKYLHVHLSDYESTAFSSRSFPKMATRGVAYSIDEWKELVKFADERGVIIIPEVDVPGHAGSWISKMPELFGTTDPKTGEAKNLGVVNMANDRAYEALDLLVGDLVDVFSTTPYIHIGTDETGAGGLMKLPEYEPYCRKHGLTEALNGNAHELFLHFIQRMNEIVRSHGKTAISWNDFGGASTPNVNIPRNLVTMIWTGSPEQMSQTGHPIINCCWVPLYMVPPQQRAPEANRIYDWNVHTFGSWQSPEPEVLPDTTEIMGAQVCFWEQRFNEVLPILRSRLPAFAERIWNEKAGRTFEDFAKRLEHTDRIAQQLILPVTFQLAGLIEDNDVCFEDKLSISMRSSAGGTIRYTLKKEWEYFPNTDSDVFTQPITIDDTTTVSARLFDDEGKPVGGVTQQRFRKIIPAYQYRLLGPVPQEGWSDMPDFAGLQELKSGVTGLMDKDRSGQINRSMFAQLQPEAHIDVRVHDCYNPLTLELNGQVRFPVDGEYTFKLRSRDGLSQLDVGGRQVVGTLIDGREYVTTGMIKSGTYPLSIRHFYRNTRNELNVWVKQPGTDDYEPFENLVLPIAEWSPAAELGELPADAEFRDPVRIANSNLATGKPVTVSGGTEGQQLPALAVDGDTENGAGWHASPEPQWLEVDLGKAFEINRIHVHTWYDGNRYYQYTIEVSTDHEKWMEVVDMTKNVELSTRQGDEHNFDSVSARYVKIHMLNNSANPAIHLNELMVFESER